MLNIKDREFLLLPKALPTSSHYQNLRYFLKPSEWNKLRKKILEAANYHCQLCLAKPNRLEVHELWRFNHKENIQYLSSLVALCRNCHSLQHVFLLKLLSDQGKKNDQLVINHYNNLTKSNLSYQQFYSLANKVYQELEKEWTIIVDQKLINF